LIRRGIPLCTYTSLRAGGTARFLCGPPDADGIVRALRWAAAEGVAWTILGGGTNTLFSDAGFEGLVIRTDGVRGHSIEGTQLAASAGEPFAALARFACDAGLSGLEWACGIPGSVGGAVAMNAGTREGDVATVLESVGSGSVDGVAKRSCRDLALGYRESAYRAGDLAEAVVEATFELVASTPERTRAYAERLLSEREAKIPAGATAGCTFRNPSEGPTAGELLDRAGCKGMQFGAARVSEQHANFIVNEGERNAADILRLIDAMRDRVRDAFGIELVAELVVRT